MKRLLCTLALTSCMLASAQSVGDAWSFRSNFRLRSDLHWSTASGLPNTFSARFHGNTYVEGSLSNKYLRLDLGLEEMGQPLPGFEDNQGRGLSHLAISGRYAGMELRLGDYYTQFGSGMLLRAYRDENLGIDNAFRGVYAGYDHERWGSAKLLVGQPRKYFDRDLLPPINADRHFLINRNRGWVYGADYEIDLGRLMGLWQGVDRMFALGGSYVIKQEDEQSLTRRLTLSGIEANYQIRQPQNVHGWSLRGHYSSGGWELMLEHAQKGQDPAEGNAYTFGHGAATMLTSTYTKGQMSLLLGVRRSENFDFRAARREAGPALRLNHLLPFTQQQTYTLAALYPYATQPLGEWALQSEWRYKFKRKTVLGGRYGSSLRLGLSYVRGLEKSDEVRHAGSSMYGEDTPRSSYFGLGDLYFYDANIEYSRKVSKNYSFSLTYLHQAYNQEIIEGHAEHEPILYGHIGIYEGRHRLSSKVALRTELQYRHSRQGDGDWIYGQAEVTLSPGWVFSVSDLWNHGRTKAHYYLLSATSTFGAHRLQLGWGKTRAGINCSGGVCRVVPETNGVNLSYSVTL